jgi:hypothetical protein
MLTRSMKFGLLVVPCTTCFWRLTGYPVNGMAVFSSAIMMVNWNRWILMDYVSQFNFDSTT